MTLTIRFTLPPRIFPPPQINPALAADTFGFPPGGSDGPDELESFFACNPVPRFFRLHHVHSIPPPFLSIRVWLGVFC